MRNVPMPPLVPPTSRRFAMTTSYHPRERGEKRARKLWFSGIGMLVLVAACSDEAPGRSTSTGTQSGTAGAATSGAAGSGGGGSTTTGSGGGGASTAGSGGSGAVTTGTGGSAGASGGSGGSGGSTGSG